MRVKGCYKSGFFIAFLLNHEKHTTAKKVKNSANRFQGFFFKCFTKSFILQDILYGYPQKVNSFQNIKQIQKSPLKIMCLFGNVKKTQI